MRSVIPLLEVQNLVRKYGAVTAVSDVSFSVHPGEVLGFLGPNGAGKTTTIKACAGLLAPTAGDVSVCGHSIVSAPLQAKSLLGYVPENPFLYDKLTGFELLDFMAAIYLPWPPARRRAQVTELLQRLDLQDRATHLVETYSKGMRQKLALAAALVHEPPVLLLDEPTVGLDAPSARRAKDLIRLQAERGGAVLFTTHVLEIAERICDRIVVIDHGRLIASGTLDQLRGGSAVDSTLEDVFMRLTAAHGGDAPP